VALGIRAKRERLDVHREGEKKDATTKLGPGKKKGALSMEEFLKKICSWMGRGKEHFRGCDSQKKTIERAGKTLQ